MQVVWKFKHFWFHYFQVPVPVFLPTTLQGAEQIIQTIKDIKNEASADPTEADCSVDELSTNDQKPGEDSMTSYLTKNKLVYFQ